MLRSVAFSNSSYWDLLATSSARWDSQRHVLIRGCLGMPRLSCVTHVRRLTLLIRHLAYRSLSGIRGTLRRA